MPCVCPERAVRPAWVWELGARPAPHPQPVPHSLWETFSAPMGCGLPGRRSQVSPSQAWKLDIGQCASFTELEIERGHSRRHTALYLTGVWVGVAMLMIAVLFVVHWHEKDIALRVAVVKHDERYVRLGTCPPTPPHSPPSVCVCGGCPVLHWWYRVLLGAVPWSSVARTCAPPRPSPPRPSCAGSTRAHRWVIGYVCHELRNPLHVLKASLSILLERARPGLSTGTAPAPGAQPEAPEPPAAASASANAGAVEGAAAAGHAPASPALAPAVTVFPVAPRSPAAMVTHPLEATNDSDDPSVATDALCAIQRMEDTVNDVLDFRKLDANLFTMSPAPVDLEVGRAGGGDVCASVCV
jgi:hypothetical protein